jgi:hypothetical protein
LRACRILQLYKMSGFRKPFPLHQLAPITHNGPPGIIANISSFDFDSGLQAPAGAGSIPSLLLRGRIKDHHRKLDLSVWIIVSLRQNGFGGGRMQAAVVKSFFRTP